MEQSTPHPDDPDSQAPRPQEPGASRPEAGHQLFSWIRSTGVIRPDSGWAGGVMAALASRLGWDAALVRGLGVVALILFFSPTALLYGLAWILLPNPRGEIHLQEAMRGTWSSGVFGGGLLAVIGGVNVFTPVSLAGPFAVLLNLAVLGAVVWAVWALVRRHRQDRADGARPDSGGQDSGGQDSGGQDSSQGKAPAGSSSSARNEQPGAQRDDGRPAWYPRDTADHDVAPDPSSAGTGPRQGGPPASSGSDPAGTGPAPAGGAVSQVPVPDPAERAEGRRRSLLTLGMVLLAAPLLLGAMWLAGQFGATLFTGLLVGLAGGVVVLAVIHIIAAARGRRGRGGLLTVAAALMLVVFAAQSASTPSGTNHIFGSYHTTEESVNSAFSDTTVDLRHLEPAAGDGDREGSGSPTEHLVEVNGAFNNTTVVVPDDALVMLDNGHAMGNLNIRTQELEDSESGIAGGNRSFGPDDAGQQITLDLNSAFGNITVYDATSYAEEEDGLRPGDENPAQRENTPDTEGQAR